MLLFNECEKDFFRSDSQKIYRKFEGRYYVLDYKYQNQLSRESNEVVSLDSMNSLFWFIFHGQMLLQDDFYTVINVYNHDVERDLKVTKTLHFYFKRVHPDNPSKYLEIDPETFDLRESFTRHGYVKKLESKVKLFDNYFPPKLRT